MTSCTSLWFLSLSMWCSPQSQEFVCPNSGLVTLRPCGPRTPTSSATIVASSLGLWLRVPGMCDIFVLACSGFRHRHRALLWQCFAHFEDSLHCHSPNCCHCSASWHEPSSTHSVFHLALVLVADSTIKADSHRCCGLPWELLQADSSLLALCVRASAPSIL